MDSAVNYIKSNQISDPVRAIRILMEKAETTGADGPTKKRMVIDAYQSVVQSQQQEGAQTPATYESGAQGTQHGAQGGPYGSAMSDVIAGGLSGVLPSIPPSVISLVIDSIVSVTQSAIAVNAKTGCWKSFTGLFKRKTTI